MRRLVWVWFFLFAMPANAALPLVTPGQLTICSAINRPPMEFYDADQKMQGVDIELGTVLAAQLQLKPQFINIEFAGLVPALLAGHCDIILAQFFITPERLKVIDEIPYMNSQLGLLVRAGSPPVSGLAALSGKTVVTVAGTSSAVQLAKENIKLAASGQRPIRIVPLPGNMAALQQLQAGQADAYAVAYETGLYYAHLRPEIFALGGNPYFKQPSGIGITKGETALNEALRGALAVLHADGTYARIFQQWQLGADMQPP